MRSDQLVRSGGVLIVTPRFGEGELLFRRQHRKFPDILEIT